VKKVIPIRACLFGVLVLAFSALFLSGCATVENDSARPWNAPKTWETGLPSSAFEGR
jgi:hypothetical protein